MKKTSLKNLKIYLAGHNGMVGRALFDNFKKIGAKKIIISSRKNLDLLDVNKLRKFVKKNKPDIIINCAGRVGGILANSTYPVQFLNENILIQLNLINLAFENNVKHFINLGSSCIYPKNSKQPIKENYLLTSPLEKTNEAYALAKIIGLKACDFYNQQYKTNYFTLMPCNLYGPNDNYDLKTSHFFPALIFKALAAKKNKKNELTLWGSGRPKRELMYVDDLADACIYFLNKKTKDPLINIGTGHDKSILEYAKFILKKIDFKCKIVLDKSKPDGTKRKIIDNSIALSYGWKPKINLDEGFDLTLKSYLSKSSK